MENDLLARAKPAHIEVVVPSYNHGRFVSETLRSIFRQALAPARLLVIDDGSRDDSPAIIERTLAECPFPCELVVRPNRGLCATLNEAFSRTSGEFFAYIGSDDTWEPHFLSTLSTMLESDARAVAAYGHAWIINERGDRISCSSDGGQYFGGDMRLALLAGRSIPKSPTVLHRRSALGQFSWNERSRLEDYEMYLRLSGLGPFAFTPHVVGSWRQHDSNVSANVLFMLDSALDAHDRVGPTLGVASRGLKRTRAALVFRAGGYYLDVGDRRAALECTARGLRGAANVGAIARRLVKLATPTAAWRLAAAVGNRGARPR